jgi:hypothetical protein
VIVAPEIISFCRFGIEPGGARGASVTPEELAAWIADGRDDDGRYGRSWL